MSIQPGFWRVVARSALALAAFTGLAHNLVVASPLVTGLTEVGTTPALDANVAIVTSASSPSASGTSAALVDEAFSYTTRTHEWTAARTDAGGLLNTAATGTLQPFPAYLLNREYIQIANNNRAVTDYSLNMTFTAPVRAYLLMDNRQNGLATGGKANTTDPDLTGQLAWVTADGWTRVNTGFMPNGQADYLGIDEGATVANEAARTHHDPGAGAGLNNFFAIYTKTFTAGAKTGVAKAIGNGSNNMYGVVIAAVPEPTAGLLAIVAAFAAGGLRRRTER